MYIHEITYKAKVGDQTFTEKFYFDISEQEALDLNFLGTHQWGDMIAMVQETQDAAEAYRLFSTMIEKAYCVPSLDGKSVDKSPEHWKKFAGSNALSEFLKFLVQNPGRASEIIAAINPDFEGWVESSQDNEVRGSVGQ